MNTREPSRGTLRSSIMTQGVDRATHRSLFYSMGWHPEHLRKPLVAVVNSFNELMPGHVHLQPLCQAIKLGIAEAGGTPLEFPSIAVCDQEKAPRICFADKLRVKSEEPHLAAEASQHPVEEECGLLFHHI